MVVAGLVFRQSGLCLSVRVCTRTPGGESVLLWTHQGQVGDLPLQRNPHQLTSTHSTEREAEEAQMWPGHLAGPHVCLAPGSLTERPGHQEAGGASGSHHEQPSAPTGGRRARIDSENLGVAWPGLDTVGLTDTDLFEWRWRAGLGCAAGLSRPAAPGTYRWRARARATVTSTVTPAMAVWTGVPRDGCRHVT